MSVVVTPVEPVGVAAAPSGTDRAWGHHLRTVAVRWMEGHQRFDATVQRALSARHLTPAELLHLQVAAHRYGQQVELAAKLVEKSTSAVRRVVETPV
jgi:hypothetical protein